MKRSNLLRIASIGALTIGASLIGSLSTHADDLNLLPEPELLDLQIVHQDPGMTVLEITSSPETAGAFADVMVDGFPAASMLLAPGPNIVAVPTGAGYVVDGPEFAASAVGWGGGFEDPGDE